MSFHKIVASLRKPSQGLVTKEANKIVSLEKWRQSVCAKRRLNFFLNTQAMLRLMCTKRFRNSTVKHASDLNTATGQSMGVTTFDLETATGKLSNKAIQRCAMFSFFGCFFFFFFLNFLFLSGLRHKIS